MEFGVNALIKARVVIKIFCGRDIQDLVNLFFKVRKSVVAGTINAYCIAVGIPFIPEAMTWESEHRPEWDIWKDWHADAAQSTGIQKNVETFSTTIDNSDLLRSYYENQEPYYRTMKANSIEPTQPV